MVERFRASLVEAIPQGGKVLVVSRGDEELLKLGGLYAAHFPQGDDGGYAGYYPADGQQALSQLLTLQAGGAQHIAFPTTSLWWLDHYAELRDYLQGQCRTVLDDGAIGKVFALAGTSIQRPVTTPAAFDSGYRRSVQTICEIASHLLPADSCAAVVSKGDPELLKLGVKKALHFPQADDGGYAGYYPANDDEAIAQLEQIRSEGAQYVVFPASSFWWLVHYPRFAAYLDDHYRVLTRQKHYCLIYDLETSGSKPKRKAHAAPIVSKGRTQRRKRHAR
jgi:hypothetical protein